MTRLLSDIPLLDVLTAGYTRYHLLSAGLKKTNTVLIYLTEHTAPPMRAAVHNRSFPLGGDW